MSGVNKVIIVGRLGADPEMKSVGASSTVTRLSVATSEDWLDKEGKKQERTEWHKVVVWGKLAEICGKYLTKGRQVYLEGRLQTRSWDDKDNQKRYTTEVVANTVQFLGGQSEARGDSRGLDDGERASRPQQSGRSSGGGGDFPSQDFAAEPSFDSSEEIPF